MLFGARILCTFCLAGGVVAAEPEIVSKGRDEASKLVNDWFAAGEAAGLAGVFYDNRDRRHSSLGIATYPQLQPITYSEEQLKVRADWGGQRQLLPGKVVVGNSSTASSVTQAGSHQRMFYTHPKGLAFLDAQYRSNALYIYPEHRDHDPGDNGPDGYGDLYPANSPYLISSQGSSGSDRVFMHAFLKTIAAFPPETQKSLISKGLLMPTLQAIFRKTYKPGAAAKGGYFTGAAHPSAFDGKGIDTLAMVTIAHAMKPDAIPPVVKLNVVAEPEVIAGRDFFEPPFLAARGEVLADAPGAIARIVRGPAQVRTMRVSAAESVDPFDRPLRFRWVILRGDPERITIEPKGEGSREATISVRYHPRRPIAPSSAMWSSRVDIGVFALAEGSIPSAPAFISFTSLRNEHRTYDEDGRLLEIFYGARSQALGFPPADSGRWDGLLARFDGKAEPRLSSVLDKAVIATLVKAAQETMAGRSALAAATEKLAAITKRQQVEVDATNKARVAATAAHKKGATEASKAALDAATAKHSKAKAAMREGADGAAALKAEIAELRGGIATVLRTRSIAEMLRADIRRVVGELGLATQFADHPKVAAALKQLKAIGVVLGQDPTANERYHLEQLNRDTLAAALLPDFFKRSEKPLYADPRLTAAKNWRDVYQYDADTGNLRGWMRYLGGEVIEFAADGRRVVSRRPDGTPDELAEVEYRMDAKTKKVMFSEVKR